MSVQKYVAMISVSVMGLGVAYGETTGVPVETAPLEKTPDLSPMDMPVLQVADTSYRTVELGQGVVGLINQSIVGKDWERLKQLLDEYPSSLEYDPILYRYALGAWYRSQFKHAQAIELYRQILTDNPEFHYVRFDLAVMLFENKQYQEAKAMLLTVKPSLNTNMQALADHYVRQINKRKQARVDISGNYEKTDNVNNAGSATQIQWQGRTWQKSTQSLPKKAEGVRYGVDVQKDVQIDDNHYVSAEFDFDGVRYWDNGDYDEQTVSLGLGYKHQNAVGSVAVMPFASYLWFGGDDYYHEAGVNANINRRLSQRLNVGGGMSYTKRYYDDERLAHRYDSTIKRANVAYRYVVSPNAMVFGGADVMYDGTQDKEYASVRYGVNVGVLAQADNGIGGRVSLRYAKRVFDEPETLLYGFVRRDDEYYVQTAFWHDKWQYKGFVPNFNISYQKIDSNMRDLYTRDGLRSFISIEKRF